MTQNVIIMIGDGMGWELARAAAIQAAINAGATGTTLSEYYTEGTGTGLSFQNLSNYTIATTYGTTIAPANGTFSTGNSALNNSDPLTGESPVLPGFTFEPTFNPGTTPTGGATNPNDFAVGNLVGYDPVLGGPNPWTPGSDPEYIKHSYPDSANTASTLYTGVKSYNNAISVDIFEQPLETILETAAELGKSTGVVTSVPIDHATPAAAEAHVNRRSKYDGDFPALDNILQQALRETQPTVILGGGHPLSGGAGSSQPDYTYVKQSTIEALRDPSDPNGYGYTFVERGADAANVLATTAANIDPNSGDRLLGIYGAQGQGGNLPWMTADGDYSNTGLSGRTDTERPLDTGETNEAFIATELNENPTLTQLTSAALDVLEDDPDGFWLMVEGGDIDWAAHDDNLDNMIGAALSFSESVQEVIDWIGENGGWEDNLLLVTADHDHYLTLNDNFPQLLQEQGAEALTAAEDPTAAGHYWGSDPTIKYGWGSHTNRPVPVYYQGDGAEVLDSLVGQGYESYGYEIPGIPGLVDQSNIYTTMYAAVTEPVPEPPKTVYGEPGDDQFDTSVPDARGFVGEQQILFTGSGNDQVDLTFALGGNRVDLGSGDDLLFAGANNRIIAGSGNDLLYVGSGGGNNVITGGTGADQFWVVTDTEDLPANLNTITDFISGSDVIGFANTNLNFAGLTLVQDGQDTLIQAFNQDLVKLLNVQVSTLSETNFVFA